MIQKNKVALITGVTGQDGAYLSELLLDKGYEVHGIKRRSSLFNTDRIDHLYQDPHIDHQRFKLHYGDLTDSTNLIRIIQQVQPDEIYNLAAMSHVAVSFETPEYTANADGIGTQHRIAARAQRIAEGREQHAAQHQDAGRHQDQREPVVHALVRQPFRRPDAGEPIAAAGERVPLVDDGPGDLRESQSEHREVDAREPQGGTTHQQRDQGRRGDATGERPGGFDFKAIAKHDAWNVLRGTSKDAARQQYVELVAELAG